MYYRIQTFILPYTGIPYFTFCTMVFFFFCKSTLYSALHNHSTYIKKNCVIIILCYFMYSCVCFAEFHVWWRAWREQKHKVSIYHFYDNTLTLFSHTLTWICAETTYYSKVFLSLKHTHIFKGSTQGRLLPALHIHLLDN